jgi:AraC-like DNA-binding protein
MADKAHIMRLKSQTISSTDWARTLDQWVARGRVVSAGGKSNRGTIERWLFPGIEFLEILSDQQTITHEDQDLALQRPFCLVTLQIEGTSEVTQGIRSASLKPGDFVLRNMGRPSQVKTSNNSRRFLIRTWLDNISALAMLDACAGQQMTNHEGPTAVAATLFLSLHAQLKAGQLASSHNPALIVSEMITYILNANYEYDKNKGNLRNLRLIGRIEDLVHRSIRDSDLNVTTLAKKLGLSTRHIHRVFAMRDGGISRYIANLRLDRCRAAIANPAFRSETITDICLHWGFSSTSHFSAAFKKRYGQTATEYRKVTAPII